MWRKEDRSIPFIWLAVLLLGGYLSACVTTTEATPTRTPTLQPYVAPSASATASPRPNTPVPVVTPAPTSTPLTHKIEEGETLLILASIYGVSLEDLLLANPEINPRLLSVGQEIVIPGPAGDPAGILLPTATPLPLQVGEAACFQATTGGLWCLAWVRGPQNTMIEAIIALVTLVDAQGNPLQTITTYGPLNIVRPEMALPLAAFFNTPDPDFSGAVVEVISAVPLAADDERYRFPEIELSDLQYRQNQRSLELTVSFDVPQVEVETQAVLTLLAVAWDREQRVVGFTVHELPEQDVVEQRTSLSVESLGGPIERVEVWAEWFALPSEP